MPLAGARRCRWLVPLAQVLRVQSLVQAERVHTQYKSRVADLEAQLQKLKDQLLEQQRLERESSRRGASAAAARTPPLAELDDDL